MAAEINVLSGSTLTVDAGTLQVNGDVNNAGTLEVNNGTIDLTGDWTNTGTFTAGNGTVAFTAAAGITQSITSGGVGVGHLFNHLSHSGLGTVELINNAIDINGNFSHSAGTFDANGLAITCAGNWVNTATFTHGNSSVTFDGTTAQSITSSSATYHSLIVTNTHASGVTFVDDFTTATFTNTTADSKMTFKAGETYIITGVAGLVLDGGALGDEITIVSDAPGSPFVFDVTGADQTVSYVRVQDSYASSHDITANTSVNLSGNDDGEESPHWIFGVVTRYWVGSAGGNWTDNSNWSTVSGGAGGADYPNNGDTAIFDGNDQDDCVLDADITLEALSVGAMVPNVGYSGKVSTAGFDLTVTSTLQVIDGELELDSNSDLQVDGVLTIDGGILDAQLGTIDANSDVVISSGSLIAPNDTFNVNGNFTRTGGTFTNSNGTLIFDGTSILTSGGVTFNHITIGTDTSDGQVTLADAADFNGNLLFNTNGGDANFILTNQTLSLAGASFNLTNADTFTATGSTVIFDGNTSVTSAGHALNHVQLGTAGTGGTCTILDALNIDGTFTVFNGGATTWDISNQTVTFSGATIDLTDLDTFTSTGSTVTFDGVIAQTVSSGSHSYNALTVANTHTDGVTFSDAFSATSFTDTTADSKLVFHAGDIYTITGAAGLVLDGGAIGDEIILESTASGTPFTFNVTGGAQTVTYVSVKDAAASGNDITANLSINLGGNDDADATPHWIFGAVDRYWVGSSGGAWADNNNWSTTSGGSGGVNYPTDEDTAIFDGNDIDDCTLDSDVTIDTLSVQGATDPNGAYSGKIDTAGFDITILSNLDLSAGELELATNSDLQIDGTLTIDGGTMDAQLGTVDANSHVVISSGALIAPSGTFDLSGNFTHSGGTFTHSSGSFVINDNTQTTTISGNTTFYDLNCITPSKAIQVEAGSTQTITHTLNVDAQDSATKITMRSTVDNTSYTLDFPNDPQSIIYVDLKDCVAGTNASIAYNSIDSLGNTNWTFLMVDPYGIVFNSLTNDPIESATVTLYTSTGVVCTPGVEISAGNVNPQITGPDGAYAFDAINGDYYLTISSPDYTYPSTQTTFPAGRIIATGSKGEVFTVSGEILEIDQPVDGQPLNSLLQVKKDANKNEAVVGDIVVYSVSIKNENDFDVESVYIEDKIPAGFKYVSGKTLLDNVPIADPSGNRPLTFNIGTISTGTTKTLKYQLVVGSGVTFGDYENIAWAKQADGTILSNQASEKVEIVYDPLFDLGTVMGKVFWDKNENGVQDPPTLIDGEMVEEGPISYVKIMTEDGLGITTDKNGQYHVKAVVPGRHVYRLDERTLPEGFYLTTDKAVIVDIGSGLMEKVNFGVNRRGKETLTSSAIRIVKSNDSVKPRLNVAAYVTPKDQCEFRMFTNYSMFMDHWKLEIFTEDQRKLIKAFEGKHFPLNETIFWNGTDKNAQMVDTTQAYAYVLSVFGKDGKRDTTTLRLLNFVNKGNGNLEEKDAWINTEIQKNSIDIQTIAIEGETIIVHHPLTHAAQIHVVKGDQLQEVIHDRKGSSSSQTTTDIIVPAGEFDIEVLTHENTQGDEGDINISIENIIASEDQDAISPTSDSYREHIKVGDDYLFFVAMGDAKAGIQPVQKDDAFKSGFWSEGKLAYSLKGKIKGKYLITSSLDTDREKKELYQNLDPEKYYPVYGDDSQKEYAATNSQGMLYLLIEWDKSSILWGNFDTSFNETEFAKFNRTLYGGKVHYESVATTRFSEPRTKLIVFKALANQRSAHNEFKSTGGSLFYLKDANVIEGSENIQIEVRDKITGLVLSTKTLEEELDYDMDYETGRITFWKPVASLVESDTIISSGLLDGNPVYVVVDYEYESLDDYEQGSYGVYAKKAVSDYVSISGTYVNEGQLDQNYNLRGTDMLVHLGANTEITAEYAQSESEGVGYSISTDGGITFTDIGNDDYDTGAAYGIKGESNLWEALRLTSYYKRIEKGFSSAGSISQQGKELFGFEADIDLGSKTKLKVKHDTQKLIQDGNTETQIQVGAQKTETSTLQVTHASEKLTLSAEYRHQRMEEKLAELETLNETEENALAVKAAYQVTDKIEISVTEQLDLDNHSDHKTTVGVETQVSDKVSVKVSEVIDTDGTATSVTSAVKIVEGLQLLGDYTMANEKAGERKETVTLGMTGNSTINVNEKTDVNVNLSASDSVSKNNASSANNKTVTLGLGGKTQVDDTTDVYSNLSVGGSTAGGNTQTVVFGASKKLNEGLSVSNQKSFTKSQSNWTELNTYGVKKQEGSNSFEASLGQQLEQSSSAISKSNLLGLSGKINDRWSVQGSYEKGDVQNYDGTQTRRNAGSINVGYVEKDLKTGEVTLKSSSKLELRFDQGQEDEIQYLVYNAIEGKINPDTTVFVNANVSQTKNTTTDTTEAQFKEFVSGVSYRPLKFDQINLLGQYTYLENTPPAGQTNIANIEKEKSHVLSGEFIYDLNEQWQWIEKIAFKQGEEKVTGFDFTKTQTQLTVHKLNYSFKENWKLSAEYRHLSQKQSQDEKQGVVLGIIRDIGENIQVEAGYNFVDFNDDLTDLDYSVAGPYVRITGAFYNRTPEEIERAKQQQLEQKIKQWSWDLVQQILARPDNPFIKEINRYYLEAQAFEREGKLIEAKKSYHKCLQLGEMMYAEVEQYIYDRIELEKEIKRDHQLALQYYREGKLLKAKQLLEAIKLKARPKTIYIELKK